MVPPQGKGSGSKSRTHGRDLLNGGSGGGRSRGGSRGFWSGSSGGGRMARVGAAGKGRKRLPHPGLEVVSSARLDHGWVREGEEMERKKGFINELE